MKSLLVEASTIEKATAKAWNEANKPKEFTIKVHDEGERNFFGLTRRPAALSILFVPQRDDRDRGRRSSRDRNNRSRNNANQRSSQRSPEKNTVAQQVAKEAWRTDWQQCVTGNVREIVRLMGIHVPCDAQTNGKVLTLTFRRDLMEDSEEQRMFFASLSYLSIQFLKRQFRNRFIGYRIVVTSKGGGVKKTNARAEQSEKKVAVKQEKVEKVERAEKSEKQPRVSRALRSSRKGGKGRSTQQQRVSSSDNIAQDQNKFAQQQLALEEAQRAANSVDMKPAEKREESVQEKPKARVKEALKQAAPSAEKEQAPAPQAEKKAPAQKKEKPKYRAFYVLPEDDEQA